MGLLNPMDLMQRPCYWNTCVANSRESILLHDAKPRLGSHHWSPLNFAGGFFREAVFKLQDFVIRKLVIRVGLVHASNQA